MTPSEDERVPATATWLAVRVIRSVSPVTPILPVPPASNTKSRPRKPFEAERVPIIVALPVCEPSHSPVTPVSPEPSPVKLSAETANDADTVPATVRVWGMVVVPIPTLPELLIVILCDGDEEPVCVVQKLRRVGYEVLFHSEPSASTLILAAPA